MTDNNDLLQSKISSKVGPRSSGRMYANEEEFVDPAEILGAIWQGKWLIALLMSCSVLLGGYYAYFAATPWYTAQAVVKLETRQDQIVDIQSVVDGITGDTVEVNSEVEVLRSRGLIGKLVDELDLSNDPEFNQNLQPLSRVESLRQSVSRLIGGAPVKAPISAEDKAQRTRDAVITVLLDRITIGNIPKSLVFTVTTKSLSPEKAALLADTLVELYIVDQIAVKFEATQQATEWLSLRVSDLRLELETAEQAVAAFNTGIELVSPEALQGLERQLKETRDRVRDLRQRKLDWETKDAEFQSLLTAEPSEISKALSDPLLSRLALATPFNQEAFDRRLVVLRAQREAQSLRNDQQLKSLTASEEALAAQIDQQSLDLIELQQLTREAEATGLLYEYFLSRLKETSAQSGIQQADSRILSPAVVPNSPSSPKKKLVLALSAVLGLLLGLAVVLVAERRRSGFRDARRLEEFTGHAVLGQIPQFPLKTRRSLIEYLLEKPTSQAAEAVRNLRTSVLLSNVDAPPKVILLTSSFPAEGKTTNSIALAHSFAGLGKKVLLVEGDLRRRSFTNYFPSDQKHGVVSVLSGETPVEDAILHNLSIGIDVLCAEQRQVNSSDLFASTSFKNFIAEMRDLYDFVIIDTPPVLALPDARVMASQADATLLVVRWDDTDRDSVIAALNMFENVGRGVSGLVLSQISTSELGRNGYGNKYVAEYYGD